MLPQETPAFLIAIYYKADWLMFFAEIIVIYYKKGMTRVKYNMVKCIILMLQLRLCRVNTGILKVKNGNIKFNVEIALCVL